MSRTVMVLGAGGNAAINFVKSLRLADPTYRIVGCDLDAYNLAACDVDARYLLPRGLDADAKTAALDRIIADEDVGFVHAQPDPEVGYLCSHGARLGAEVFGHRRETWQLFANKLECQERWRDALGVSFAIASLGSLAEDPTRFEALVARSGKAWIRATRGAGSRAALPVTTLSQAQSWARYWIDARGLSEEDFMVAEFLPGAEYAVQTFWIDGELVHSQARERLVYFFGSIMPSGQSSTPAVAVTVDQRDVYDTAYAAIRAIDEQPHGIYCVDLKRDVDDAVIPMEVNYGRFFTTNDFFAQLGVNTPHALISSLAGEPVEKRVESVGAGTFWIRGLDREPFLTDDVEGALKRVAP